MRIVVAGIIAALVGAGPARAVDVASGSIAVSATDAKQMGRLSRNGIPQDFAGGEPFPGEINPARTYSYTSFTVPFAKNAREPIYYDITVDDPVNDLFASAYLGSYDPAHKDAGWLGDAGTSGNYFGVDALFFDVVVPKGGSLLLVFNSTADIGPTSTANYFVQAFSDSEYDENFLPGTVPEPAAWALMVGGFGLVGGVARRQRAARPA